MEHHARYLLHAFPPHSRRNVAPMKPKPDHALHLRPAQLLPRPRIQTQQITLPPRPIQHDAQTDPVVFAFATRIRHENGLPWTLRLLHPRFSRLRRRVVFQQSVEEGRVTAVADAVDVPEWLGRVGGVVGGEFGRESAGGGEEGGDLFRSAGRGGYVVRAYRW